MKNLLYVFSYGGGDCECTQDPIVKLPLHSTSENGDLDPTACLLIKLLATSKQVLGSHHNVTKEVELELQEDDEDKHLFVTQI